MSALTGMADRPMPQTRSESGRSSTMTTTQPNINHNDWTSYDAHGYLGQRSVEVRAYDDGTVRIGSNLYPAHELTISEDRIDHVCGWYLTR